MQAVHKWIWSGLAGLIGIAGLFVSAGAEGEPVPYWGGIAFFAFAVLFIFLQVKFAFDRAGKHRR